MYKVIALCGVLLLAQGCTLTGAGIVGAGLVSAGCNATTQEFKDKIVKKQQQKGFRTYLCGGE